MDSGMVLEKLRKATGALSNALTSVSPMAKRNSRKEAKFTALDSVRSTTSDRK